MDRREFISAAAALGATAMWANRSSAASRLAWREDRDLYPQGVASGDPDEHSVILWTRRPFAGATAHDADRRGRARSRFHAGRRDRARAGAGGGRLDVPRAGRRAQARDDLLVSLHRRRRRTAAAIGRTITAPRDDDPRPVRFAFVSCQSVNEGAQNAYRRMIWEDERAPADRKLGFVLHLGDFIYEVVEYPDEVPHRYERTVYDIGRIPDARKVGNFHVPTNARRLSPRLSRAHRRSRHPGRARAFPVRLHRRQSRILVAGLAELHQIWRQGRARAAAARRRQPGVVGIYPVARAQGVGRRARSVRAARGRQGADRRRSTITASATSPTTAPRSAA